MIRFLEAEKLLTEAGLKHPSEEFGDYMTVTVESAESIEAWSTWIDLVEEYRNMSVEDSVHYLEQLNKTKRDNMMNDKVVMNKAKCDLCGIKNEWKAVANIEDATVVMMSGFINGKFSNEYVLCQRCAQANKVRLINITEADMLNVDITKEGSAQDPVDTVVSSVLLDGYEIDILNFKERINQKAVDQLAKSIEEGYVSGLVEQNGERYPWKVVGGRRVEEECEECPDSVASNKENLDRLMSAGNSINPLKILNMTFGEIVTTEIWMDLVVIYEGLMDRETGVVDHNLFVEAKDVPMIRLVGSNKLVDLVKMELLAKDNDVPGAAGSIFNASVGFDLKAEGKAEAVQSGTSITKVAQVMFKRPDAEELATRLKNINTNVIRHDDFEFEVEVCNDLSHLIGSFLTVEQYADIVEQADTVVFFAN